MKDAPPVYVPPIGEFTPFERAVLQQMAVKFGEAAGDFQKQVELARVVGRQNTIVGFYTDLTIETSACRPVPAMVVDDFFKAAGVANGVGVVLYARDGYLTTIEGYTMGGDELTDAMIGSLQILPWSAGAEPNVS